MAALIDPFIEAWDLRELVRRGELCPQKVAEYLLARIERHNPALDVLAGPVHLDRVRVFVQCDRAAGDRAARGILKARASDWTTIVGRPNGEFDLLSLASSYEAARPRKHLRPRAF